MRRVKASKACSFEKKKQKTFGRAVADSPDRTATAQIKVFWSFFSKKDCLLAFLAVMIAGSPAWADSADEEAQTSCNPYKGTFEIRPFLFSDAALLPDAGFTRLAASNTVSCKVGSAVVTAQIVLTPPSEYHCAGAGYSVLKSLRLNARELLPADIEIGASRAECDSVASGAFKRFSRLDVMVGKRDATLKVCMARGPASATAAETCTVQRYDLAGRTAPRATHKEAAMP